MASNLVKSDHVVDAVAAAEAARSRVSTTMDEIQNRLDPRRIALDAVERVQSGGRALAIQAGDAAKAHPVAIGTAVAALGLAMLARNRLSHATINFGDVAAQYTDYDDGYGDAPPMHDAVAELAASPKPGEPGQANAFVSIVVGLVAGAVLGALLPVTETERRTLGEVGDFALAKFGDD